jgi:flavin-dependent dehydrogenase
LAAEAERAGAELMFGRKFEGGATEGEDVLLPSLGVVTQFLIGADGARSPVARAFGLGRNRRYLVGLEVECEPIKDVDPRFLHCFADSRIAPGYIGWVVPGVGATQIGVAASHQRKPDLKSLVDRVRRLWGLEAIRVIERRSGIIPSGGPVRAFGKDRVLLIGDAAGLVSPVTGGRNSYGAAFRSACCAARG